MATLDDVATKFDAFENVDSGKSFQRRARVLQALWRIEKGYSIGEHNGRLLGSALAMPWAEQTLANFLTEEIRQVVQKELDPVRSKGKLYGKPRIFNNLLSSQPLAFNLFAMLKSDLRLATSVFSQLSNGRCGQVTKIEFEESPGRGESRYLGDHSAFDVYVEFVRGQEHGFIGIEVKYHEDLRNDASDHHGEYDRVAAEAMCFNLAKKDMLREKPLQQIWRDHLLACSILQADKDDFQDGFFVFLSPQDNQACNDAITGYRSCLSCANTFQHWTLESVVQTIREFADDPWIAAFQDRYLNFAKVDRLLTT